MMSTTLARTGFGLVGSGMIPLLLVLGLLMAPVTCTCGASVPHGHFLFQLPYHHHSSDNHASHNEGQTLHGHSDHLAHKGHHDEYAHQPHRLAFALDPDCKNPPDPLTFTGNFVLSNMMEQQDGAVLKAPPSSSTGQPMVMAQPSSIVTPAATVCEHIDVPATRTLEGRETSPETPPPRA